MGNLHEVLQWVMDVNENLLLLGNGFHTSFLDWLMWTVTGKWIWAPLYFMLAMLMFRRAGREKSIICLSFIALMILATDQTCATILRPAFKMLRPSSPDNPIHPMVQLVNGYHGGRYGFPSCHAANTFALATFLSMVFRNRRATILLLSWSLIVSYSRIYLGVHYPGDIIGGFIVGGTYSIICYKAAKGVSQLLRHKIHRFASKGATM